MLFSPFGHMPTPYGSTESNRSLGDVANFCWILVSDMGDLRFGGLPPGLPDLKSAFAERQYPTKMCHIPSDRKIAEKTQFRVPSSARRMQYAVLH
jgi:hypothetical protein